MRRFSRLCVRQFSYLLLLVFLLQLATISPVSAQIDIPAGDTEPVEVVPPMMAYQPPADANEMRDFAPADAEVKTLAAELDTKATTTFDETKNSLVTIGNERVGVFVEEKTFNEGITLEFTEIDVPKPSVGAIGDDPKIAPPPITATNTISNPVGNQDLIRFQLDIVTTAKADIITDFEKPVRIVIDVRSLTKELNPVLNRFYLAYQDEKDPNRWHDVPLNVYQKDGLISADVMHFSNWAAGVRPERWNPSWTPPSVSAFSGAAAYSYPIEVPPGRSGLQPNVSLAYSSRALDGLIRDPEEGAIGTGWSLAEIKIVRVGVKLRFDAGGLPETYHPDQFRLLFNGTGYELYPVGSTSADTVRYYIKDAPGMFVERYYDATNTATDGLYWIVITPDGTRYRLGRTDDSEEYQTAPFHYYISVDGHGGHSGYTSAVAWNVDTVTDPFGNQMTYEYYTRTTNENISYWDGTYWQNITITTRSSRIATIKYNYPDRVTSLPADKAVGQLTSTPGTRIEFRATDDNGATYDKPITSIYIYHGSETSPTTEYRIESGNVGVTAASSYCINYNVSPNKPLVSNTWTVNSIRQWVNTNSNPADADPGYALPSTTFTYSPLPHRTRTDGDCFSFMYLTGYQNGYGGAVTFSYSSDNRSVGIYQLNNNIVQWPEIGYNYTVTSVLANDGRNPSTKTTYAYTQPCYGQWGTQAGVLNCGAADAPQYGNIVGHLTTTQTNYDYDGLTPLNTQTTTFSQAANTSIGRPTQVDVFAGSSTLMSQTTNNYQTESINGLANMFTYTSQTITENFSNGATSPSISSKVQYRYDPNYQPDGTTPTQFGNLTHIFEFDDKDATVAYRTTRRWYDPNTTNWIVNKPSAEGLYEADGWTFISGTWNYYDGSTNFNNVPTQGFLTRTRQVVEIDCTDMPGGGGNGCATAYQTIDTTFTLDSGGFGNQARTTTYSDFGYRSADANFAQIINNFPSNGRSTTITYDADYNLYPVSVKNDLTQETKFDIYGFKNANNTLVPVNGFQVQPGLLASVTDPNDPNGLTTTYEYDPFGRLYQVYEPGDSQGVLTDKFDGDPAMRYRYWDNSWNNSGQIWGNPTSNIPFGISVHTRPNVYSSSTAYVMKQMTYYDGFGRPIQEQAFSAQIDGVSGNRTIVTTTDYNPLGQVSCTTVPYDISDAEATWPNNNFQTASCTSKDNSTTTYDALSRPSLTTPPDGNQTAVIYGLNSTYTQNAENQLQASFTDNRGRLTAVDETLATYTNSLNVASDLNAWTTYGGGTVSIANGYATVTHQGTPQWTGMRRTLNVAGETNPEKGVAFSFRTSNTNTHIQMYLASGTWDTNDYRFWGLQMNGGTLRLQEWEGDANGSNQTVTGLGMTAKANTWYDAVLRTSQDTGNDFILAVWERDNPAVSAEIRLPKDASWQRNNWVFDAKTTNSYSFNFDNYQELTFNRTFYGYDLVDNLTNITDSQGNPTTIGYDNFGRKTSMNDPDMGVWSYDYDAAGNLIEQTDANGATLCFTYDQLDRILSKEVGSSPCPGSNILASYSYVASGDGIGQLKTVSWGPDSTQNKDTFSYDSLGRMVQQDRLIGGRLYTLQTLTFDSLNRPLTIQYPNGEIITKSYDAEGENSLTAGSDALVSDVRYNARGQLTYVDRVHAWNLDTQLNYFGASNNFRLDEIINGNTTDNRPDFSYTYDDVGNILSMVTATNGTGTDTQTFTYDSLNRLITASGTGNATAVPDYNYSYSYDPLGNILGRTDNITSSNSATYGYGSSQPHAVNTITTANNNYAFGYDANGNMISRLDGDGEYTQIFDKENRLIHVVDKTDATFSDTFDTLNSNAWTINGNTTAPINVAGDNVIRTVGTGVDWSAHFKYPDYTLTDGNAIRFEFRTPTNVSTINAQIALDTGGAWNSIGHNRLYIRLLNGTIDGIHKQDNNPADIETLINPLEANTWYVGVLVLDDKGGSTVHVYKRDNPAINGTFRSPRIAPDRAWRFYQWTYNGTTYLDDFSEQPATLFGYDAAGQRTWSQFDNTMSTYPFAGYEEEITPGSGSQANLPGTGSVMSAVPALPTALDSTQQQGDAALLTLFALGSLMLLFLVGVVQMMRVPKHRVWLRLTWRHRVTVSKIISLVSLVGLLGNSLVLTPTVQAAPAAAPLQGPVQPPWANADIGSVGVAGSADETSGTFTIDGAGADIGGTVDAFHYVYQSLSGDGEIIANVASLTGGGSFPLAGLMIRESLADDAIHVSTLVRGNRIRLYERTITGSSTTILNGYSQGAPEWLRIVRTGNSFDLYHSNNGTSWLLMQTRTVTMGTNVYIGLAVTGNSTTTLATGTFDNVTVTGGVGGGPTATPTPTNTPTNTPTPTATSPGSTATPSPTPTATATPPPNQPEVIVQRTTYTIAGQTVFLRLRTLQDKVEVSSYLYAMHTDHLGSTSTLSYLNSNDGTAYRVYDSRAFYTPFGDYRLEPTGDYTDQGYTGHLGNNSGSNDIGLIYMNARFYVPYIYRMLTPDSIVPDPANPQSFNRYAYVRNNPLKYVDPSGHCWGFASGLRNTFYQTTCENIDQAISIIQHDDASAGEKALAVGYVGAEALAHTAAAVGSGAVAVGCLTGAGTAVCAGAGSAVSAASADGDPTNEIAAAANGVSNTANAIMADGDPTNEVRLGLNAFSRAAEFGIDTYTRLRKAVSGTGLQVHHIVEKRFASTLGIQNTNSMSGVALTPGEHQVFTNAWRSLVPYGTDYATLTRGQIWMYAQEIYANHPELLEAARTTIFGQ